MASITAMLSTLTFAVVVGHSVQHRPITLVHVAGTGPRILVVGSFTATSPAGLAIVRALERTHPKADLWLVPVLDPDGLSAGTRQNAHGSETAA
jgi:murein tripeptide amidase MpaA